MNLTPCQAANILNQKGLLLHDWSMQDLRNAKSITISDLETRHSKLWVEDKLYFIWDDRKSNTDV